MNAAEVVATEVDWVSIRKSLFTEDGNENAGVLLAGKAGPSERERLLVRRFLPVPANAYAFRGDVHLEVSPNYYNEIVSLCEKQHLSPLLIHSHPGSREARYSPSDDFGERRLLKVLHDLLPGSSPASMLVSTEQITGRRLSGARFVSLGGMRVAGRRSEIVRFSAGRMAVLGARFGRQVLAFGAEGQAIIQRLRIGIVGLGGTGSIVAEQLARMGVGDLTLVDDDLLEETNLSRVFGAKRSSVGRRKVEVAKEHVASLGADRVGAIFDSAIYQRVLMSLRDRDLVFSCVDNDRSRAILNRFAHQYLIPVVDLGVRIDARGGVVRAAAGRVVLAGSGLSCLRCSHYINSERIRAESMPRAEREALSKEGYVMGIDYPVPAVASLNAAIAGMGVTAAVNMFVNLTGEVSPMALHYDVTRGVVFSSVDVHDPGCDVCDEMLGLKGLGDAQPVSAY